MSHFIDNYMMSYKKEIIKNIFNIGMVDMLGLVIPIITMPILARSLGPSLYGHYMLIMTILTFGHTIIDYGIQFSGVRDVVKIRNDFTALKQVYGECQGVRWTLSIGYIFIMLLYAIYFLEPNMKIYIAIAGIPYVLGYVITSTWFFQGVGHTLILMYSSLFSRLVSLFVIIFFVKEPADFYLLLTASTWPIFISSLFLFFSIKRKYNVCFFSLKNTTTRFKKGINVFIGLLMPNFYNAIPVVILGTISSPSEFAKFAIASRLCSIVTTIQDVFAKSIYPVLSKDKVNHIKTIVISNLIISLPITIAIFLFGERLLQFFLGKAFSNGNIYLSIIVIGVNFVGIANAFGQGFFLSKGYDNQYRTISIRVSILSSALTFFAIFEFGLVGGAIAITIARLLLSLDYIFSYLLLNKKA